MATPIIIFGAGGTCADILDTIEAINAKGEGARYHCLGFLDDDPTAWGREVDSVKVLGPLTLVPRFPTATFVNGIGSPRNFLKKPAILSRIGLGLDRFETLVHPGASVARTAKLGRGAVILPNATLATNAFIGHHVVILSNSVVSHDVRVEDYACIAGGACLCGGVVVGRASYVGAGSVIAERVRIGEGALVGMGSVVLGDVAPNSVVVGNPARFLRKTNGCEGAG